MKNVVKLLEQFSNPSPEEESDPENYAEISGTKHFRNNSENLMRNEKGLNIVQSLFSTWM